MWSSLEAAIFEPASPSFVAGLGLITKILRNQRIYSKLNFYLHTVPEWKRTKNILTTFILLKEKIRVVSSFSGVDANYKQQRTFKFFVNFVLKLILHVSTLFGNSLASYSPPERATREISCYKTILCLYKDKDSSSKWDKLRLERFRIAAVLVFNLAEVTSWENGKAKLKFLNRSKTGAVFTRLV